MLKVKHNIFGIAPSNKHSEMFYIKVCENRVRFAHTFLIADDLDENYVNLHLSIYEISNVFTEGRGGCSNPTNTAVA